jgi:TonB family protein
MSNFLSYLIEASLILTVLYTGYFFVLRQKAAPGLIRTYLLVSLLLALSTPFIHIPAGMILFGGNSNLWAPASLAWSFLPELVVHSKAAPEAGIQNSMPWLYWLNSLYLAGACFCLLLSSLRLLKIRKLIKKYPFRYSGDYSYQLANTNGQYPTFSFLHYIFWDNTAPLSPDEAQQVLRHEKAHVKYRHSLDILLLELASALLWFNPLIYLFRRSLQQAHEFQADQYALQQGEEESYLSLMVKQSFRQANIPLVSTFFQHNTLTRIRMIKTKPTHTLLRAGICVLLAASVFFVGSCEDEADRLADQSVAPPPPPTVIREVSNEKQLDTEQVFEVVEEQPEPAGGIEAFYKFIGQELLYPEQAKSLGIEGRVFVQFIVNENGMVSEVQAVKGIGGGCDKEAERVIKLSKWTPGKQNGRAVKVRMIMPIMYKL